MRIEYNLALYYDRDKEFRPVHVRRKWGAYGNNSNPTKRYWKDASESNPKGVEDCLPIFA